MAMERRVMAFFIVRRLIRQFKYDFSLTNLWLRISGSHSLPDVGKCGFPGGLSPQIFFQE
jgi:hypothetical protein